MARRFAAEIDGDRKSVENLLALAADEPKLSGEILRGVAAALNGRRNPPIPANWDDVASKLSTVKNNDVINSLNVLGIAFRDQRTIAALRQQVEESTAKPEERAHALEVLLTAHPKDLNVMLRRLVSDPDLALTAVRGLAAYDDQDAAQTILEAYDHFTPEQRTVAINTLVSRVQYAQVLVRALGAKQLKPADISAFQARQLMALGDASISSQVRAMWGDVRQTSGEKRKAIDKLRNTLTPILAKADLANGKALFAKTCATCHTLFGQGAKIGPDLTGSNRKSLDYLLENVVDPSAVVAAEFRVKNFTLSDGRILGGIVREQNDNTITVETPDSKQVIDRQNVDETTVSEKSLMPDGLLQGLSEAQVRDLLAYLMSNG